MKLSTRSRYGLRAVYDLALNRDGPVAVKVIAQRQDISEAYLEQLFASLKRAKLVKSLRGAQGGYQLARPPEEISIGEVLRALEGSTSIADCVGHEGCGNSCTCPSHPVFAQIQRAIDQVLDGMTLMDMVEQNQGGSAKTTDQDPEEH